MRRPDGITLLCLFALLLLSRAAWSANGEDTTPAPVNVEISGIEDPLLANVRAFLDILKPQAQGKVSPIEVHRLFRSAPEQIRRALQPFGYYQPRIHSNLERQDDSWLARFQIDKGPATHLSKVHIEVVGPGKDNPQVTTALNEIRIKAGQQLNQSAYKVAKDALANATYAAGYLDNHYTSHTLRVEPARASAQIDLVLDTGPRYYFGQVDIQQDILNPDFVQRFVHIRPGEPFNTDQLLNLQLALRDSSYFETVEVHAEKKNAGPDHHIPVTIRTSPTKPQKYTLSLGYGTDTGPRVGAGVLFRHINKLGHQLNLETQVSAIKTSLTSQYKIPIEDISRDYAAFTGTIQQQTYGDVHSRSYSAGISINDGWLDGRRRLYFKHVYEIYSFGSQPSLRSDLSIPGISWSRKVADDPLITTRGISLEVDTHGASDLVYSDTSFIQGSVDVRAVYPLATGTRLLLHTQYGATGSTNFRDLPPSQRFFTGGARSVRGYGYQELAPRDSHGNVVGGRYLDVGSVEVDKLVYGNFGLAAFFDAGNADNQVIPRPKRGVGIGFRYRSPVGMVRVDFAHPLDDPNSNFAFHVSIGPDL